MKSRLRGMIAYLAGPMDRVSRNDAVFWRDNIKPELRKFGVGIIDPCDKPLDGSREDEALYKTIAELKEHGNLEKVREIYRPICGVDLRFVDLSSFVIAYIDVDSHMCGTYHEVVTAINQKKPVLCVIKQGRNKVPNWLTGVLPVEHIFNDFDELFGYLEHVHHDEYVDHMKRWTFLDYEKVWGGSCHI